MSVDLRLNALINALDGRLKSINIDDVELSVRTLKALKDCGVRTLHEAQMALINRQLQRQWGIGPKAVREVEEIIFNVTASLPPAGDWARHQARLELNSLLLACDLTKAELLDLARAAIRVIAPAMEQETVAKIVAWLRDNSTPHNDIDEWADEIEAKWGEAMTEIERKALALMNEVRTEYPLVSFSFNKEKTNA